MVTLFKFLLLVLLAAGFIWAMISLPSAWNYCLKKLDEAVFWVFDSLKK